MLDTLLHQYFPQYKIKKIDKTMIDEIFAFQKSNSYYYETTQDHSITHSECLAEIDALPPNKSLTDKTYVAFYEHDKIIAILDLMNGYPTKDTLYIGFFMLHPQLHQKQLGTYFIERIKTIAKQLYFSNIELGCIESNTIAYNFWKKQNFQVIRKTQAKRNHNIYTILSMKYKII